MKRILLFLFLTHNLVQAQVKTNKVENMQPIGLRKDTVVKAFDIRERLVQLALNNPSYEITDRLTYVAMYQLHLTKGNWLAALSAQGNLNEFTIQSIAGTGSSSTNAIASYFPKYNFGISIPFDIITRNSNNVKIARENVYIAQAQKNDKFRQIKADVLTKYEDFLLAKQKLDLQSQMAQDAYTNYQVAERDYRLNVIKAEDYNKAYRTWADEQIKKLELQRNLNVTKIEIERLIGVKLDDVLREGNPNY
jgi:outer membrane protein TolC